ncbi:MAG: ROK family transcriptional regulator [Spirochaetaceae bacterium]
MHPSIKNSINKTRVLQEIRKDEGISRIQIAKILNLDKSTISKITSDLLEQGLIFDKKTDEELNHAGRRRIKLSINDQFGVIVGLEVQTEFYNVVIITLNGEILQNYKEVLPVGFFLESLDVILESVIKKTESEFNKILGIGIGIPGHINTEEGIICRSNPLNIEKPISIYEHFGSKYSYPIFIGNDANCCCWGELTFTKGKRENNFLVALGEARSVNISDKGSKGLATGLGMVIDGKVLLGDNFSAGEFKSFLWKGSQFSQYSISDDDAFGLLENRENTLIVIEELVKQLALYVNSFNFTKVIFAGIFNDYKMDIKRILTTEIKTNWGYSNTPEVQIEFTTFGDYDVSYGAAGMVVERFFTTPDITTAEDKKSLKGIDLFSSMNFAAHE